MEHAEDDVGVPGGAPGVVAAAGPKGSAGAAVATAPTGDSDLLEQQVDLALGGDSRALDEILRTIHPIVVRYCRSRLSDGHRSLSTADDVAQEVCMAVIGALPGYRREGRPFLAFVYGIASHKVIDAHRAGGRSRSTPVADVPDRIADGPGPESLMLADSVAGTMAQLLRRLPMVQQEVLRLRVVVGLSAEETANSLNMTAGAVRVAQHRALGKLRSIVEGDTDLNEQLT